MQCKKCGADNPINRLYCDECGAELEHAIEDIQAAVDREIKQDKAKVTSRSIRWLLGVSFVLMVVGIAFRNAYKDLPANDVVPFVAAPLVELGDPPTVATTDFGLGLPAVRPAAAVRPKMPEAAFRAAVAENAFRRAAVTVQAKGTKEPVTGLIVTDLVLQFTPTGSATPTPIHAADIAALTPTGGGLFDLTARSLDKPLRGSFADPAGVDILILRRGPDKKITTETIPLRNVTEITPAEAERP
jgi:hypothetical protein